MMKKLLLSLLVISAMAISCQPSPKEKQSSLPSENTPAKNNATQNKILDKVFHNKLKIILVEEPDSTSSAFKIQDYVMNGSSFIPVFTSGQEFSMSTGGVDIQRPIMDINGVVFLSLLEGNEVIKVNPSLPNEMTLLASDLIARYKTEIDSVHNAVKEVEEKINQTE